MLLDRTIRCIISNLPVYCLTVARYAVMSYSVMLYCNRNTVLSYSVTLYRNQNSIVSSSNAHVSYPVAFDRNLYACCCFVLGNLIS